MYMYRCRNIQIYACGDKRLMATPYDGNSEIQDGDGLQTLILMKPRYLNYSDAQQSQQSQQQPGNFVSNHHGNPLNNHHQAALQRTPSPRSQAEQFVGIPLSAPPSSSVHSQHAFIPRVQQRLSLSLSSQQSGFGSHAAGLPANSPTAGDDRRGPAAGGSGGGSTSSASGTANRMQSVRLNSTYSVAIQELLEEVVNVGKGVLKNSDQSTKNLKAVDDGGGSPAATTGEGLNGEETESKHGDGAELTTSKRQEFQMKKAKLVNMLDELEQRYRQYQYQMQIVISWFEQAAGIGSAKSYTALALQTISKQFRCLKDMIMGQLKAASKSLGEEESSGGGRTNGGSGLKFLGNQLRKQRALQQLRMTQHNAWRPQRGLPAHSVSVLRAWLFEHFLHPYPKDSDKHMLAKQTGLTRSQVSNWFINARVRLWKPMVEEMYLEETKEQEENKSELNEEIPSSKQEKSLSPEGFKSTKPENSFNLGNQNNHPPPPQLPVSTGILTSPTATGISFQNPSGFTLIGSSEMAQFSPKKPRNNEWQQSQDGGSTLKGNNPTDFLSSLGGYTIGEIGRFSTEQFQPQHPGHRVSLTLGLPHCDNLSISGAHQSFLQNQDIPLSRGVELGVEAEFRFINPSSSSHSAAMYESMNIQNRKRFAEQLLPDFAA